jgi:hypothetical protein
MVLAEIFFLSILLRALDNAEHNSIVFGGLMMRRLSFIALIIALLLPFDLPAQKRSSSKSSKSSSTVHIKHTKTTRSSTPRKSTVAARDKNGRIKRSAVARNNFMRQTGYPHGRKGYVVDHVVPLECGGADSPSNMQWQTVHDAKIKDRTRNCRR